MDIIKWDVVRLKSENELISEYWKWYNKKLWNLIVWSMFLQLWKEVKVEDVSLFWRPIINWFVYPKECVVKVLDEICYVDGINIEDFIIKK